MFVSRRLRLLFLQRYHPLNTPARNHATDMRLSPVILIKFAQQNVCTIYKKIKICTSIYKYNIRRAYEN